MAALTRRSPSGGSLETARQWRGGSEKHSGHSSAGFWGEGKCLDRSWRSHLCWPRQDLVALSLWAFEHVLSSCGAWSLTSAANFPPSSKTLVPMA